MSQRDPRERYAAALRAALGREPLVQSERGEASGYRTYEVHQRQRVGESTEKLNAADMVSGEFASDPWPVLETLRENYPCYRNWLTNEYWISRYDDVTSVFADDANFETRGRAWASGDVPGRDLGNELAYLEARAQIVDGCIDEVALELIERLDDQADLATGFAAQLPLELLVRVWGVPETERGDFARRFWRMQLGAGWEPRAREAGRVARAEMLELLGALLEQRRAASGNDVISALAHSDLAEPAGAADLLVTLLESDWQTLHGGLANLWFLLLTHPDQLELARSERRLLKLAWLETLRHSPPVLSADRFARQEVERFGLLLPEGALVRCSAAAANRDPRVFAQPDKFDIARSDLCQREPRGQYRADGLCSGIAFGLGKPSRFPAVPEDRPRSWYAIVRDTAVRASEILLQQRPVIQLEAGAAPTMRSSRVGELYTCWQLRVGRSTCS